MNPFENHIEHQWSVKRVTLKLLSTVAIGVFLLFALPSRAEDRAVTSRVPPVYPEIAKRMKISGSVKIEVTIDATGKVTDAKTVSGSRMLAPAAEDAVRHWKFAAGDGTATTVVEITFSL